MTGIRANAGAVVRVKGKPEGGFSTIPNSIFYFCDVSPDARLVLAYLAGRPEGWIPIVGEICASLGLSRSKWEGVKRDFKRAGITPTDHPLRFRGEGGEFLWELEVDVGRFYGAPKGQPARPRPARQQSRAEPTIGDHCSNSSNGHHCRATSDGRASDGQRAIRKTKEVTRINHHPDPSGEGGESGGGFLSFRGKEAPDDLLRVLDAAGVAAERRQLLLDEFDGACAAALAAGKPVEIEKAYLRRLAVLDAEGDLVTEHAERIAGDRRDRAAAKLQAVRQKAARLAPPKKENAPAPEKPSSACLEALGKLRKIRAEMRGG